MFLRRTLQFGLGDVVLSHRFASATTAQTVRMVCPINGYIYRVLFVRGGVHSSTEVMTITSKGSGLIKQLATGQLIRYTDNASFQSDPDSWVGEGDVITVASTGSPTETTPIGVFLMIKRR